MLGVQTSADATLVVGYAREEGLLLTSAGPGVLRFLPPLETPDDQLLEAVARLGRALKLVEAA